MSNNKLTTKDYETILNYYKIPFDKLKNKTIKQKATRLLSEKLCRCIKKVSNKSRKSRKSRKNNYKIRIGTRKIKESENRAIAICKTNVLNKKGLTDKGFKCRKGVSIKLRKYKKI